MEHVRRIYDFLLTDCGRQPGTFALLQCTSAYPTKNSDACLPVVSLYRQAFPAAVLGYSGHEENGHVATLGAVALGARIVERHVTLDKNMKGSDHR